jgi:uncharacterized repeat protein (TIGR01451 family)
LVLVLNVHAKATDKHPVVIVQSRGKRFGVVVFSAGFRRAFISVVGLVGIAGGLVASGQPAAAAQLGVGISVREGTTPVTSPIYAGADVSIDVDYSCTSPTENCLNAELVVEAPGFARLFGVAGTSDTLAPQLLGTSVRIPFANPLLSGRTGRIVVAARLFEGTLPNGDAFPITARFTSSNATTQTAVYNLTIRSNLNPKQYFGYDAANELALNVNRTFTIYCTQDWGLPAPWLPEEVTFTAQLPVGTEFVSATYGATFDAGTSRVVWPATPVGSAECASNLGYSSRSFTVRFPSASFTAPTNASITASLDGHGYGRTSAVVHSEATISVPLLAATYGSQISKTATSFNPRNRFEKGVDFAYDLNGMNSSSVATMLRLEDTLSANWTLDRIDFSRSATQPRPTTIRFSSRLDTTMRDVPAALINGSPIPVSALGLAPGDAVRRLHFVYEGLAPSTPVSPRLIGRVPATFVPMSDMNCLYSTIGRLDGSEQSGIGGYCSGVSFENRPQIEWDVYRSVSDFLVRPGDTRSVAVTIWNNSGATGDTHPVLNIELTPDLVIDIAQLPDLANSILGPATITQVPSYYPGYTNYRYTWPRSKVLEPGQQISMNIPFRVRNGAMPSDQRATFTITDADYGCNSRCGSGPGYRIVQTPLVGADMQVYDSVASTWRNGGLPAVVAGGDVVPHRAILTNVGNESITGIIAYTTLPSAGDTGVSETESSNSRGSTVRPTLHAAVSAPSGVTVAYSQSSNPCRPEVFTSGPVGCTDDWSTTPPADITTVRALRFDMGTAVLTGAQTATIPYSLAMPAGMVAGDVVWSSTAVSARSATTATLLSAEGINAGAGIPLVDLSLTAEWATFPASTTTTITEGNRQWATLTVNNAGPFPAAGVRVTGISMPGIVLRSASTTNGAFDATTGEWNVGGLAIGASATLTFAVDGPTTGTFTMTPEIATATPTDRDSTPGNAVAGEDDIAALNLTVIAPPRADIELRVVPSAPSAIRGDDVSYTIEVENRGPEPAAVNVRSTLPVGATNPAGWVASQGWASGDFWSVGTLAVGGVATLRLPYIASVAGSMPLTAQVEWSSLPDPDSTPNSLAGAPVEDDEATAVISVGAGPGRTDLSLHASVNSDTSTVVPLNEWATVMAEVRNDGTETVSNIVVGGISTSDLSMGLIFAIVGSIDGGGNWTVDSLAPGESAYLEYRIAPTTAGIHALDLEIAAMDGTDYDSTPHNGVATEDDFVHLSIEGSPDPTADFQITTDPTRYARIGRTVSTTFIVKNTSRIGIGGRRGGGGLPLNLAPMHLQSDEAGTTGRSVSQLLGYPSTATIALYPASAGLLDTASISVDSGNFDPSTNQWSVNLGEGEEASLTVSMDAVSGPASIQAEIVRAELPDPDSTPGSALLFGTPAEDDEAQTTIIGLAGGDLTLTGGIVAAAGDLVASHTAITGTPITVELQLTNEGLLPMTPTVSNLVPAGAIVDPASWTLGVGFVSDDSWELPELAAGETATIRYSFSSNDARSFDWSPEIWTTNEDDLDSTPANTVVGEDDIVTLDADVVPPPSADIELEALSPEPVRAGSDAIVRFRVTNRGPNDSIVNVQLRDGSIIAHDRATVDRGAVTATGLWSLSLPSGATATLQVPATAIRNSVRARAEVVASSVPDPDSNPGFRARDGVPEDDEVEATVTSYNENDLALTATVANHTGVAAKSTEVDSGQGVTVTVHVENQGTTVAEAIAVGKLLPVGERVQPGTTVVSGGSIGDDGVWRIPALAVGDVATLTFVIVPMTGAPSWSPEIVEAAADIDSTPGNSQAGEDDQDHLQVTVRAVATQAETEHPSITIELRVWSATTQAWVVRTDVNVEQSQLHDENNAAFRITITNTGDVDLRAVTTTTDIGGCTVSVASLPARQSSVVYCENTLEPGEFHASVAALSPAGTTVRATDTAWVEAASIDRPPTRSLPVTGSDSRGVISLAFAALTIGVLAWAASRRRVK